MLAPRRAWVGADRREGVAPVGGGGAAGLLGVRRVRPLPAERLRAALDGVPCVLVLDRNYSPGMGGGLAQELKAALYGIDRRPRLHGMLAGVGGVSVSAETLMVT